MEKEEDEDSKLTKVGGDGVGSSGNEGNWHWWWERCLEFKKKEIELKND